MKIELPDPMEGYEWIPVKTNSPCEVAFWQVPIRKLYDWIKTGPNVLVYSQCGAITIKSHVFRPVDLVTGVWQAHIGGDPCPVDPDATMVEVRDGGIVSHAGKASGDDWSYDCIWRVTGLVEGYIYE